VTSSGFPTMTPIHLRHANVTAEVWPDVAVVAALAVDGMPLLYTPPDAAFQPGGIHRFGLWPLVPYANRAFGAKLDTGFEVFDLPENDPGGGNGLHGFGWQQPWTVVAQSETRVVLRQDLKSGGGPYRYLARFSITLDAAGATFDLSVENRAPRALLHGLGFHPWFPDGVVTLEARGELVLGAGFRPTHAVSAAGPLRFPEHAKLHGDERAANYLDWTGIARLATPLANLVITASPNMRHPVLWQPVGAPFLCLEPQTHAIGAPSDALVRALAPLTPLAPGESLHGTMRVALDTSA
jgi:aldose 1-epimerase